MTRASEKKASQCHVLNFFFDDDNGCALTLFLNGVRFHIIADAELLKGKSKAGQSIEKDYRRLISAVRDELDEDEDPEKFEHRKELDAAEMHNPENEAHDSQDSQDSQESQDSGHGTSDDGDDVETRTDDGDSAVDVSEGKHDVKELGVRESGIVIGERYAPEAEKAIQSWMLSPFEQTFKDLAPASKTPRTQTLQEWYHGPAHFFNLVVKDDELSCSQIKASADLDKRMTDLIPSMPIPKYIRNLGIPMVQAKDILVIEEGTAPEPYHPVRVKADGEVHFLKMVDMTQYQPTKREIKMLKEVEKKGLHKQIRVPQVLGLVYEESKSHIMGFLQTDIEGPTPLTKMLDSDVVEDNRKKWAKETERMVELLHQNNIVWGDAKADNFMVDKHGDLWIIDFGGSYTEGWVDPELMETQGGDDMGTEKIINALEDPESNTFTPGEEDENQPSAAQPSRKRSRSEDGADDEKQQSKRQK